KDRWLDVRFPFVDVNLLERLAPAIASDAPPTKQHLAACADQMPPTMLGRPKTGFTTPVRRWVGNRAERSGRGVDGWAANVHRLFPMISQPSSPQVLSVVVG